MSGKAQDTSNYSVFTIESSFNPAKTVDLRLGVISFNYYEDLFSPTITAKLVLVDGGNVVVSDKSSDGKKESLYSGLPLRGGERIAIKIQPFGNPPGTDGGNPVLDFSTGTTYFYVSKISSVMKEGQREIIVLDLTSREALTNEFARVNQKFPRNLSIKDSVEKIVKEKLSSELVDSDATSNQYGFMGNMKKPFNILVWLASKAVDANKEAGYFFYQTKSGFKFKSVSTLIEEGKNSPKSEYTFKSVGATPIEYSDDMILTYTISLNHDLISKLKRGMYSSFFAEFDPSTGNYSSVEQGKFSIQEKEPRVKLGEDFQVPKILGAAELTNLPSRIVSMVADVGTLEKDAYVAQNGSNLPAKNASGFENQRQSIMRYNLLFMQTLDIQVPCNTNLEVGDVIKCNFPKTSSESKENDPELSGLYMIKELCHHFNIDQSLTSMKLIRDTHGMPKI
jgi:hypothetical protein|tara:strand:- start:1196 stop:2548 length:1353 start_codon:yes stop_codon:yes gene_type:complete